MLAEAINIDGPTFVPHIVKPILGHFNELLAKNKLSFFVFLIFKLTPNPMAKRIIRYKPTTAKSSDDNCSYISIGIYLNLNK